MIPSPKQQQQKRRPLVARDQEIAELRRIGGQMADLCFTLSQTDLLSNSRIRDLMGDLYRQWGAIKTARGRLHDV